MVGTGSFGKVYQVEYKPFNKIYAMKVIFKSLIEQTDMKNYIQIEKDIMTKVCHPFIVSLKFAFQTQTKVNINLRRFI